MNRLKYGALSVGALPIIIGLAFFIANAVGMAYLTKVAFGKSKTLDESHVGVAKFSAVLYWISFTLKAIAILIGAVSWSALASLS